MQFRKSISCGQTMAGTAKASVLSFFSVENFSSQSLGGNGSVGASKKILENKVVIVMEDNEFLAEFTRGALEDIGYEVLIASNGEKLLEHCCSLSESKTPIAGVLIDLTVKEGMGGEEAVGLLKSRYPHIKAVVTSGHLTSPMVLNPEKYGFEASLKKPYSIEDLSNVLKQITGG